MRRAALTVAVLALCWIGYIAWPIYDLLATTEIWPRSRSTFRQRRAATSPRRKPQRTPSMTGMKRGVFLDQVGRGVGVEHVHLLALFFWNILHLAAHEGATTP
jgi:hypothetical protein